MRPPGERTGEWSVCGPCGKRIYARRFAERDARRLNRDSHDLDAPVLPYACPAGHGWHIGHRGHRQVVRHPGPHQRPRPRRRSRRAKPVPRSVTPLAPGEDLADLARRIRGLPEPGLGDAD